MKNLIRITLAAAVLLSASGMAKAQGYEGRGGDGRHFEQRAEQNRGAERRPEFDRGGRGGESMHREGWEHREHADGGGYGGGPDYYAPAYVPVYAAPPAYGYEEEEPGDDSANVAGAVVAGAVATGLLAAILLNHR